MSKTREASCRSVRGVTLPMLARLQAHSIPSQADHPMPETPRDENLCLIPGRSQSNISLVDVLPAAPEGLSFGKEPTKFIDREDVRQCLGVIVVINLICIGLEADSDSDYWHAVEVFFVGFYTLELLCRFFVYGYRTFVFGESKGVNFLDTVLALTGILNCIYTAHLFDMPWAKHLLIFRLLRVLRIFHLFEVLSRFVGALAQMAFSLAWIFSVLVLCAYVFAVLLSTYVKDLSQDVEGSDDEISEVYSRFADVDTAMFTLFQVTTMDNWHNVALPLVRANGLWRIFFVVFIAFTAWTMISLLTAVVSDNVISATQTKREEEKNLMEKRRAEFVEFLQQCFRHADADGNGMLDREEFLGLINENLVTQKMEELGVSVPHEELRHTFDMLDVDESGELSIEEFTKGLSQLQQNLGIKHVVAINYAVERAEKKIERRSGDQTNDILNAISALSENVAALNKNISGLRQDLTMHRPSNGQSLADKCEGYSSDEAH